MTSLKRLLRPIKHLFQRHTRGWDDSVTWSLDHEMAKHILPRLQRFRQLANGYPDNGDIQSMEQWLDILDQMIFSMQYYASDFTTRDESAVITARVEKGAELFGRYFGALWW
jgi:hypothetical protein